MVDTSTYEQTWKEQMLVVALLHEWHSESWRPPFVGSLESWLLKGKLLTAKQFAAAQRMLNESDKRLWLQHNPQPDMPPVPPQAKTKVGTTWTGADPAERFWPRPDWSKPLFLDD